MSSKNKHFPTINYQMKDSGIIDSAQFMLWMGNENGHLTLGGYDETLLYDSELGVQWFPSVDNKSYTLHLDKLYVGNVHIPHVPRIGFVDSGASYVGMSKEEEGHIIQAFDQFCIENNDKWIGKKVSSLCYQYDITMNKSLRDFFRSYPTITFSTPTGALLNWYPSEYFSQKGSEPEYCITIAGHLRKNEIILGATFLRQNLVIFDPDIKAIGFSRGNCSEDFNRVTTEVVNSTIGFYQVECHSWDYIEEEVNIILFFAVGLLAILMGAVAFIVGGYLLRHFLSSKKKIGYAPYESDETEQPSTNSIEMENFAIMSRWDDDHED